MLRAYVAIWIVTWSSLAAEAALMSGGGAGTSGHSAKVTKCCPRDMMLSIDMKSCTGFITDDQNQSGTYAWSSENHNITAEALEESPFLSILNNTPWWLPQNMQFLRASNLSEQFEPTPDWFEWTGKMPLCDEDDREMLVMDNDVAILNDGRLIKFDGETGPPLNMRNRFAFSPIEYCVDRLSLDDNLTLVDKQKKKNRRRATTQTTTTLALALVCRPCSRITCVPKCCAKGFLLEWSSKKVVGCRRKPSVANVTDAINLRAANGTTLLSKDYFLYGMKPPDCGVRSTYLLNNPGTNRTGYGLTEDGRVQLDDGVMLIEPDEYCVDVLHVLPDGQTSATAAMVAGTSYLTDALLACRQGAVDAASLDGSRTFREILYGAYFVLGSMFLAATLLIYAVLPELRVTVHSGNLIAHTVCLFVSYTTLAATTLAGHMFNFYACVVAGFVIQFTFLAAFFWLNVMCADIAWTFSGLKLLLYSNKIENEKKKYIIYSVYAWGCSIVISVLTAIAEFTNLFTGSKLKPNFGNKDCWFSNKLSVGVFFYLPIGLLLLTNFVLFLFTALRIVFIRRDTSKILNRQSNQNNTRLALYVKLFCLMGVTFVFEVISWAVDGPAYYWYVTDAVNSLRGVFVFFIFCWKRSVLDLLLARAPAPVCARFVRLFGLRESRRHQSFSSSCAHHQPGANRPRSNSSGQHNAVTASTTSSSFQLSQFGSSSSMPANSSRRPT